MSYKLVIVESPAKAKTIEKYLSGDCKVTASMGHIIDLPAKKLGIDVENNYEPTYTAITGKSKLLKELKALAKNADEVMLATDPDREGEAISFHLANYLGLDLQDENRVEFHEITKHAIVSAVENKRKVNMDLVDAQQARRVLDRLVGYKISPILWKKISRGLSAGRVQSVATKIIVDRENEIRNFVSEEYWNITAKLKKLDDKMVFDAKLVLIGEDKAEISNEESASAICEVLNKSDYIVEKVKKSAKKRKSAPPFTTSTLQQDAYRKIGFATKRTMMVAQQLYEGIEVSGAGQTGLITYMRTDSTRISEVAQADAKEYIKNTYGEQYVGTLTTSKGKKALKAQDAHEAIRPTDISLTPESLRGSLDPSQLKLYTLIYKRFIASMMSDCVSDTLSCDIKADKYTLRSTGSKVKFDGFLAVYDTDDTKDEMNIPMLKEGEKLKQVKLNPEQKFTQPPARYTEASLVKTLEELGIGRPSTYAPTISTILARDYVELEEKKFKPTDLGEAVTDLMKANFKNIVDANFTAQMEVKLDKIADGDEQWVNVIDVFYKKLAKDLEKADDIERIKVPDEVTDVLCEVCGKNMVIKKGRFGKFLACPGYPDCTFKKSLMEEVHAHCPECGSDIVARKTKRGRTFYGCKSYPNCNFMSWNKPSDEKCPKCAKSLYEAPKGKKLYCADKECGYAQE